MTQIAQDKLYRAIHSIIQSARERRVDFVENVTVEVSLMNFDPHKTRRYSEAGEPHVQICVLGDQQHCEEATNLNVPCMNLDELKKLDKNKKLVKKLAKQYDGFLASETIAESIPRILGPGLVRAGKSPYVLPHCENMAVRIQTFKKEIQDEMKKILSLSLDVGNVEMQPAELAGNVTWSMNFLVSLLKKNWHNVKSLSIKSSTGPNIALEYTY